MLKDLQFSKTFWVAISIVYSYCLLLFYAFFILTEGVLNNDTAMQYDIAIKLTSVRLAIIVFGLIAYPVILSRFLKYAKYLTVAFTAWAIVMYIEDYFVLYSLVKYPEGRLIDIVQSLRPIFIAGSIWMCFELIFSSQLRDLRYVTKKK